MKRELEKKIWIKTIFSITAALALLPLAALAGHHKGGDHAVAAEQMGDDVVWASGARGRMHTVGGAEMAKLDNVRLGDTVVVVFTEALVLSLKET